MGASIVPSQRKLLSFLRVFTRPATIRAMLFQGMTRELDSKEGVSFSNIGRAQGQAIIGYKNYQADSDNGVLQKFNGLIGSVDASFRVTERVQIGALYSRDTIPSILEENRFFIEDRYGANFIIYVTRPLSIRTALVFGKNNYPFPVLVRNEEGDLVEELVTDTIRTYAVNAELCRITTLVVELSRNVSEPFLRCATIHKEQILRRRRYHHSLLDSLSIQSLHQECLKFHSSHGYGYWLGISSRNDRTAKG